MSIGIKALARAGLIQITNTANNQMNKEELKKEVEALIEEQENLREKIEGLSEKIGELKEGTKPKKIERCKEHEPFWIIAEDYRVHYYTENNSDYNNMRWETGNYYPQSQFTLEEITKIAARKLAYDKALTKVNRWIEEKNDGWVADWSDHSQAKFYPFYYHVDKRFGVNSQYLAQYTYGLQPCGTSDILELMNKVLEPELKIIFGIE